MSTFNFQKNSGGYTPEPLLKGGEERREEGEERERAREGSPPVHIPGYATAYTLVNRVWAMPFSTPPHASA